MESGIAVTEHPQRVMPIGGQLRWLFKGVPIRQLNGGTFSIGSKIVANQGSLTLTKTFVRLLILSALITVCNGAIPLPRSSKLFSCVLFLSNSRVQLATDQKQRNNVGISLEKVVEENGDESERKHPRAGENGNSATIMTIEAAAAEEVLVKIQQSNEPTWRETEEPFEELSEKMRTVPLKEEREILLDKVQNNGNSKGLPPWDVGYSGKTVLPKDPEFHHKG